MILPAESCVFNLLGGGDPLWRHSMLDRFDLELVDPRLVTDYCYLYECVLLQFDLVQMFDRHSNTLRIQVEH
jgi:hypothetical protein